VPALYRVFAVLRLSLTALLAIAPVSLAKSQTTDELRSLNRQVEQLFRDGKYSDALPIAQRALGLAEQRGSDDAGVATPLYNLAEIYWKQGRAEEAESLHRKALNIRENALAADRPEIDLSLGRIAEIDRSLNRYGALQLLYEHWLAVREKALGAGHASVGKTLNDLADFWLDRNREAEAAPLYQRALAVNDNALNRSGLEVARSLSGSAVAARFQGRYVDAEGFYKRLLLVRESELGADHPTVAAALSGLAGLYAEQRRFAEAEPLYKRALLIQEKTLTPETFAGALDSFSELYMRQGRYVEAEPYLKRALTIVDRTFDPSDARVSNAMMALAQCYRWQRRFAEAERLVRRALSNEEKAYGPNDIRLARLLTRLAEINSDQGHFAEAEPLYKQALNIQEKAFGPNDPNVGNSLASLGGFYRFVGFYRGREHYAKAEPLLKRALVIFEKWYGPDHPLTLQKRYELMELYQLQENWAGAVELLRQTRNTAVMAARHAAADLGKTPTKVAANKSSDSFGAHTLLIQTAYRLVGNIREPPLALQEETFASAQWARYTEAAAALAQMASREARGDAASLVRRRQDLADEWLRLDKLLLYSSEPPGRRDAAVDGASRTRMAAIDSDLAAIDSVLAKDFPEYVALAHPEPLSISDTQRQLRGDEALVLFVDTFGHYKFPAETFGWLITKTNSHWFRIGMDSKSVAESVAALRCGLDYPGAWKGGRCPDLLKTTYSALDRAEGKSPPFDLVRANELYKALFEPIKDLIRDKRLLIVPSGPLTQLPFQVLVTDPPKTRFPRTTRGYRDVSWFARSYAVTVLPAVSSMESLRKLARQSQARDAYVGFGNPLLDGEPAKYPDDAAQALLARSKRCVARPSSETIASRESRESGGPIARGADGHANVADIRSWAPLPETADELCEVARALQVDPATHVYLGEQATESEIKRLSSDGALARYRIVHFATHGIVAGQLSGTSEPGLILTPPNTASEYDDGYLSASEIAGLKLDADWVILSACNTAAGDAKDADALSGLARAFFYAGARSLLVSHWEVASEPTVKLITKAVDELEIDPKIGRAEAQRRSMLSMIDTGKDYEAHPAFWAPFVLVGEGGAAR
jgi:CHAT domain-containing protein/tetratricopeptide (TPR) repeat protein